MEDLRPGGVAFGHPGIEVLKEAGIVLHTPGRCDAEQRMGVGNKTVAIDLLVRRQRLCEIICIRQQQERGSQLLQRPGALYGLASEAVEPC